MSVAEEVAASAFRLAEEVDKMRFSEPVTHVYNPLDYARAAQEMYLRSYANGRKQVIFMGMNPGPWGMAQTGVPFGEIELVRNWLGVEAEIGKPENEHPKRPIEGFGCKKSEVSGRRLWGLFKEKFGTAEAFFKDHFVANYCPLVFMEESGKNRTPDKLAVGEAKALYKVCDEHLRDLVRLMKPEWVIGVGGFAEGRAKEALKGVDVKIGRVLHPSPASPAANKGWSEKATEQLVNLGIWS